MKRMDLEKKLWEIIGNKTLQGVFWGAISAVSFAKAYQNLDKPKYVMFYGCAALISGISSYFLFKKKI